MRALVVKVTAGSDAPERCAQAFTVAATAVAAGASVSLWLTGEASWFDADGEPQGISRGAVFGTHWHGLLDNDGFRRSWLTRVAAAAGRAGFVVADDTDVAGRRDAQLDRIADLLGAHLDTDAVLGLLDGPPPRRPHVASELRSG